MARIESHMEVTMPTEVEVTLSVTMNVGRWRRLQEQMENKENYSTADPIYSFRVQLGELIDLVEKRFDAGERELLEEADRG